MPSRTVLQALRPWRLGKIRGRPGAPVLSHGDQPDGLRKYGVAGVKAAMDFAGFYGGPTRAPLAPLTADEKRNCMRIGFRCFLKYRIIQIVNDSTIQRSTNYLYHHFGGKDIYLSSHLSLKEKMLWPPLQLSLTNRKRRTWFFSLIVFDLSLIKFNKQSERDSNRVIEVMGKRASR